MSKLNDVEVGMVAANSADLIATNLDKMSGTKWRALVLCINHKHEVIIGSSGVYTHQIAQLFQTWINDNAGDLQR